MTWPNGISAIGTSFMCCTASGKPMIDREAQQYAAQNVTEENQKPTEEEKNQIAYQGHNPFTR